jgi:ribosomal protein L28/DNA-nicking Smr family endonuclease
VANAAAKADAGLCGQVLRTLDGHGAIRKVALGGKTQEIGNVANAAAKADAELCGQVLRTLDEHGAISTVALEGEPRHIANAANAAAKADAELCGQVLRTLDGHGAIRKVALGGKTQEIANVANAAAKADAELCGQVLRTLDDNGAIRKVAREGEPQAIANVANAAAKADAELCGQVLRTLDDNGAIRKVALEGEPRAIANVANAAAKADAGLCGQVLRTLDDNGAIRKVAREGNSQDVANVVNAAGQANSARLSEQICTALRKGGAFGRLAQRPDAGLMHLAECAYLAGHAGDAEAFRQLTRSNTDPNKAIQRHALAGLLARCEASSDALATIDSQDLMGMLKVAADSLNGDGLRRQMRSQAIARDGNGVSRIDLHDLTHRAAQQTLHSCLADLPRGASFTVIAGQGHHRQDGQNPMADMVRAMCADRAVSVTSDPANPGRLTLGDEPHTLSWNAQVPGNSGGPANSPVPSARARGGERAQVRQVRPTMHVIPVPLKQPAANHASASANRDSPAPAASQGGESVHPEPFASKAGPSQQARFRGAREQAGIRAGGAASASPAEGKPGVGHDQPPRRNKAVEPVPAQSLPAPASPPRVASQVSPPRPLTPTLNKAQQHGQQRARQDEVKKDPNGGRKKARQLKTIQADVTKDVIAGNAAGQSGQCVQSGSSGPGMARHWIAIPLVAAAGAVIGMIWPEVGVVGGAFLGGALAAAGVALTNAGFSEVERSAAARPITREPQRPLKTRSSAHEQACVVTSVNVGAYPPLDRDVGQLRQTAPRQRRLIKLAEAGRGR